MQFGTRAIAAWAWVVVAVVAGVALVLASVSMIISMIGVVLIILGLISLMPALMFTLEDEQEDVTGPS